MYCGLSYQDQHGLQFFEDGYCHSFRLRSCLWHKIRTIDVTGEATAMSCQETLSFRNVHHVEYRLDRPPDRCDIVSGAKL